MNWVLLIAWGIVGLGNLLLPPHKISKVGYGCVWACYMIKLLEDVL